MALIPENYYNSSSPEAKAELLQQSAENKLTQLSNKRDAVLLGLNDGDGLITSEGTIREQATNGMYYDANELLKKGFEADKSSRAMQYQDLLTARKVGKDVANITDQDRLDVANWQQIQKLADIANGPGVWEAPFARGVEKTNLTGRYVDEYGVVQEAPLNVPMTIATNGQVDKFGRKLGQVGSAEGVDVTNASASNPQLNARYSNTSTNKGVDLTAAEVQRGRDKAIEDRGILDRASNFVSGVAQGALTTGVLDTVDFVAEAAGFEGIGDEKQKSDMAKKITGYDSSSADKYMQANQAILTKNYKDIPENEKGWFDRAVEEFSGKDGILNNLNKVISNMDGKDFTDIMSNAFADTDTTAYSIGMLIGMAAGTKGLGLSKVALKSGATAQDAIAAVKATEGITRAEKAAAIAAINEEAYTQANMLQKAVNQIGKNAGLLTVNAGQVNNQIDEFEHNMGRSATAQEKLEKYFLNLGGLAIDKAVELSALKGVLGKDTIDGLNNLIKYTPESVSAAIVKSAVERGLKIGAGGVLEFPTETAQTFIEEYNKVDASTEKGQKILQSKVPEVLAAGFSGAAGAVHMGTIGAVVDGSSSGSDKIREQLDKMKEAAEIKKAETAEPGVAVEDRMGQAEKAVGTGDFASAKQHLQEVGKHIDTIDDVVLKQKYNDVNKAYQDQVNAYAKQVESTGKLDAKAYGAEPDFYLDLLDAATDKEAVAKAIESDEELIKNYGQDNVSQLVKVLKNVSTSRNEAIDELVKMEVDSKGVNNTILGVQHDQANLGFVTPANMYPALTEYLRNSFKTGNVDTRLANFASYQNDKLETLKQGYQNAVNDVNNWVASIASERKMSVGDAAKALAYLESRTARTDKVKADIKDLEEYKALARELLDIAPDVGYEGIGTAYKASKLKQELNGLKLKSVGYSNEYLGRNAGQFQFNPYEIIGDVAQKYTKTDTLGQSGAKKLIEYVAKEVDVLNKISRKATLSAQALAEMKQAYKLYKDTDGKVTTKTGEVLETEDEVQPSKETTDTKEEPKESKEESKESTAQEEGKEDTAKPVDTEVKERDLSNLTKAERDFMIQYAAGKHKFTKGRTERYNRLLEKAEKPKVKRAKKLNRMKEAVNQSDVIENPDLAAKRVKTMLDISKDNNEKAKYDDETVEELSRLAKEEEERKALEEQERMEKFFRDADEAYEQESMESAQAVVAAAVKLSEYEAFDVEGAIAKLRGSVYLNRMKKLAKHDTKADSKVDEAFSEAITKAAAEEKLDDLKGTTPADTVNFLKREAATINKMIDKAKEFVDKSKAAVSQAFLIAKSEHEQLKHETKQLDKQRTALYRERDIALQARDELDKLKAELEAQKLKSAGLTAELAKEAAKKVKAGLRKAKEIAENAINEIELKIQDKEKLIGTLDVRLPQIEAELEAINTRLYILYEQRTALKDMTDKALEQKQLAFTTKNALIEEIKAIQKAIKIVRDKYSSVAHSEAAFGSKRAGFSSELKATIKDAAGSVVSKSTIKLSDYVDFAVDDKGRGRGSRISHENAQDIVKDNDKLVKKLEKLVSMLDKMVAQSKDQTEAGSDVQIGIMANAAPGIILLRNLTKNGGKPKPIDQNVAMALKVATLEVLEQSALTGIDEAALERAYGESVVGNMTMEQKIELSKLGLPTKYMASTIGKRVLKLMGMRQKSVDITKDGEVDKNIAEQYDRLATSLGYYGVFLAKEEGFADITEMPLNEYLELIGAEEASKDSGKAKMTLTKVKESVKVEDIRDEYNEWNKELFLEDKIADVVFVKPDVKELKQSNNEITSMPKEAQENMTDMIEQEWSLKGVDDKNSAMHQLLTMSPEALMRIEGFDNRLDDAKEAAKLPEKLQDTIKGQNLSVRKAVEGMKGLANKILGGLQDNMFWFNYSFTKSGRNTVDSAGFNGQGTKLHRHMIFNKEQVSNVKLDKNDQEYKIMMLAIAQNMGQDTDKWGLEKSVEAGEFLVKNIEKLEEIWSKTVEAAENGGEIDVKPKIGEMTLKLNPVSAFADALDAVRAINAARADGFSTVKLTLTLEADGITNGFALKMLQVMWATTPEEWEFVTEWLQKTGVDILSADASGRVPTESDIAAMIEAGDIVDSYRSLARDMKTDKVNEKIYSSMETMLEREAKERSRKEDPAYETEELKRIRKDIGAAEGKEAGRLREIFVAANALFGDLQINGIVTKFGRDLMKPPFMTFMYGAGNKKMMLELAGALIDELLIKISKFDENTDDKTKINNFLNTLFPKGPEDKIAWIRGYRAGSVDIDGGGVDPIAAMQTAFMYTYGVAAVGILEDKFAPIVKINKQIRDSMSFVANVWNKAYKDKLVELAGKGNAPTKDMYMKALDETVNLFPIIKGPFSKDYTDGIAIFKKKLANSVDKLFTEKEMAAGMVKPGQAGAYVTTDTGETRIAINKVLPLLTHEYVEAATAAAVIPIHTLDGAIMSRAIKGKGVMQIFDAMMLGISQAVRIVKDYNETFYDVNMSWNYLDEVLNSVTRTINEVQSMDEDGKWAEILQEQWKSYGGSIEQLQNSAVKNRKAKAEFRRRGATMSNMLLSKEAGYLAKPNNKDDIIGQLNSLSDKEKADIADKADMSFDEFLQEVKEKC